VSVIDLHGGDRRQGKNQKSGGGDDGDDSYRQWQARQVLAILPEDPSEALKVLSWAEAIIKFLKSAPRPF